MARKIKVGHGSSVVQQDSALRKQLRRHFKRLPFEQLLTSSRSFLATSRPDLQVAIDVYFQSYKYLSQVGIHVGMERGGVTFASLVASTPWMGGELAPLQYDEVDIGEALPMRCLKNSLWLAMDSGMPFVVLMDSNAGQIRVEVAAPRGDAGLTFCEEFFRDLEQTVSGAHTYRGKAISLEGRYDYLGRIGAVQVHRLRPVTREQVILPKETLDLVERNVNTFVRARQSLKGLGLSGKKGLLFYGPPGTGKTHTIHYLSSQLPGHTTLLIAAEQTAALGAYFALARVLQPSMIVIEDVDLIARARAGNFTENTLLNSLLNEMDGLREDSDIIVILTTNRPDQLEPALASRPGRVDQAIEFPLPDEVGRTKLVELYSYGLKLDNALRELIVNRTKGASAAFIKELMRRSAQFNFEVGGDGTLLRSAVDGALEEMLFRGGSLNLKLLGGTGIGFKPEDVPV